MYIIDTSVFCASFLKEDANNEKAIELLSKNR
jgi:predicted nucleic acid-binding protein